MRTLCKEVLCHRMAVIEGRRVDLRLEWQAWEPYCEKHFAMLVEQERMLGRPLGGRKEVRDGKAMAE
jgi:hypothetical protein